MNYSINTTSLTNLIKEEVSHAADQAYADNGTALYDAVVLTTKDEGLIARFIDDAVAMLLRQTSDISSKNNTTLSFNVPNLPTLGSSPIQTEITRYIMLFASCGIFQQRRPALVPEYTTRVQNALDNIITLLRTRVMPNR